ncbi:DUF3987 domain-containing protein [Fuchsiella alkaliacetigena]|uniref:DUF3987 domain-containing protein n=1 Tax=Fuchsiella alkaliacetigena TaxID=957042 RepID=UPI00200A5A2C|nr:DUF3987 domain-containing protein [Fuchsiella alkaliacetigena]MCK8823993.1 DUF3987 domain-containing protein [Fuchsiella alkaliacetigena]
MIVKVNVFEIVKQEIDIVEVFNKYCSGELEKVGRSLRASSCPFCGSGDGFTINTEGNYYKCFSRKPGGCNGTGGSVINLVMKVEGIMERIEAVKTLAVDFNLDVDFDSEQIENWKRKRENEQKRLQLIEEFINKAQQRLTSEHREKLLARGLNAEIIDKYRFGYCPEFNRERLRQLKEDQPGKYQQYKKIGLISGKGNFLGNDRIVIPIWQHSRPVYYILWDWNGTEAKDFKYLNPAGLDIPDFICYQNGNSELWVVEGVFDFFSMIAANKSVAVAFGVNNTSGIIDRLQKIKDKLVYVAFDNDEAGQAGAAKIVKTVGRAEKIDLPAKKDINDLLQECNGNIDSFNRKLAGLKWPDPLPFTNYKVEELAPAVLPEWLRDFVESVAEFTQTPVSMAIMLVLSALGTALANKGEVEIKRGYTEPLNIWTCSVLPTGSRKSPVFSKVTEPIEEYEKRKTEEIAPEKESAERRKDLLKERIKNLEKQVVNTDDEGQRINIFNNIDNLADEVRDFEVPSIPILFADDVTTESLAQLMANNFGRFAVLSPEGDIFKIMGGLYSRKVNLNNYKKGWTGKETIKEGRMGRKGVRISKPALTMGLTVQPTTIRDLESKNIFRGEGLLARFLYIMPDSLIGNRKSVFDVAELDKLAESRYKKGMQALLNSKPEKEEGEEWEQHKIKLSTEAKTLLHKFSIEVEKELREDGRLYNIRDWGNKLTGNVVRIAGLLHLAAQVDAKKGEVKELWDKPLSGEAMLAAVSLGRKLMQHALKVFSLLDVDPEIELARYVLKRIKDGKEKEAVGELPKNKDELDRAALYKLTRDKKDIKKPDDLEKPLKLLTELNYIRLQERKGRLTDLIKLNPKSSTLNALSALKGKETEIIEV